MSIVVYWLEEGQARCAAFAAGELTQALALVEARRRAGCGHVCLSTDFTQHVGQPGVDSVEQGRTPDGRAYEWSKAGRAGKARRR